MKTDPEKAKAWRQRSTAKAQENRRARVRAAQKAGERPQARSPIERRPKREKAPVAPERRIEHPRPVERVVRPVGARRVDWHDTEGKTCVICKSKRVVSHHTVYEQEVRRRDRSLIWDVRNRTPICGRDHMRHHDDSPWKIPLAKLPDAAIEFAIDLLGPFAYDYLRRHYSGDDPRLDAALNKPGPGVLGHEREDQVHAER